MPSEPELGALVDRLGHLSREGLEQIGAGERSDVRVRGVRVADPERGDDVDEARFELVGDRLGDQEPLRGDARLTRVLEACPRSLFGGDGDIGIGQDDERV